MRKTTAILIGAALLMGLTGCGSQNTNAENTAAVSSAAQVPAETAAEAEDPAINLYFVRHGKTILNTLNRVQGWSDSPLTEAGTETAENAAYGLSEVPFDLAYASDRMRAVETAQLILDVQQAGSNLELSRLKGLRECNYGKYEGDINDVMWGDIMEHLGVDDMQALLALDEATRKIYDSVASLDETGEAESYDMVAGRLMESVEIIINDAKKQGAKNVLVVGHGGAIGVILSQMNGASVGELGNASVSQVEYSDGKYQVLSVGDMSYCESGEAIRRQLPAEPSVQTEKAIITGAETGTVEIYLTRHGKTVFNTMGRTQGWVDSPLTAAGREVAENLGRGLSMVEFAGFYSSDMGRATETARIIMDLNENGKNAVLTENAGLRETYYGKYEGGINMDMLNAALAELGLSGMEDLDSLDNGIAAVTDAIHRLDETGEAESYEMMSLRVRKALDDICKETAVNGGGNIMVVAHGNAIMSILNSIGDANVLEIENASVSKLIYQNGTYTIESVNDTSYTQMGAQKQS